MTLQQTQTRTVETQLADLMAMLAYCRPAGSKTERRFIRDWIRPLDVETDERGNLIKRIGDNPRVLWSAHTDTVHRQGGEQRTRMSASGVLSLPKGSASSCLGADNTAGVWMLREMILAGKPGLYVFHRAEECGGLGSRWIADHTPELAEGIECAIAFDRMGKHDVITHQCHRTCSDAFAESLCKALGLDHKPDPTGIFTDTANYTEIVRECTNISVGFSSAHTSRETLDTQYLFSLLDAVLWMDTSNLVIERNCDDPDDYAYTTRSRYKGWHDWNDPDEFQWNTNAPGHQASASLERLVREYPDATAEMLESYGISADELAEYIFESTGFVKLA